MNRTKAEFTGGKTRRKRDAEIKRIERKRRERFAPKGRKGGAR